MSFATRPGRHGERGFDAYQLLTEAEAVALRNHPTEPCTFAVMYASRCTPAYRDMLLDAGFALMFIGSFVGGDGGVRGPGWVPSAALALGDANLTLTHLTRLEVPQGVSIWLDLEGVGASTGSDLIMNLTIDYADAWARRLLTAYYAPGIYVGDGVPLTPRQLHELVAAAYWCSESHVQDVAVRGYQMRQLLSSEVAGLTIDYDFIARDFKGGLPTLMARA